MVVTLLSFLLGVLDSDRKETAKSNAQEELQAAMSYIADDLQEATYIYGADALAAINDQLPHRQGIADGGTLSTECNANNGCTPVLVFWKRYYYDPSSTRSYTNATSGSQILGCMPYKDNPTSVPPTTALTNCTSSNAATNPYQVPYGMANYTNSLVAYYLKSDANLNSSTWSNTARILRWELKDGYVWYCSTGGSISDTSGNCPTSTAVNRAGAAATGTPLTITPVTSTLITSTVQQDRSGYFIVPDKGFLRISFTGTGTLSSQASAFKKFDYYDFNTNPFVALVDFMDDTQYQTNQGGGSNAAGTGSTAVASAGINVPIGKNITISGVTTTTNPDCDDPSVGVGNPNPLSASNLTGAVTQRVPADFSSTASTVTNPSNLSSFYACVAPESVTARVYLRGNALARLASPPVAASNRPPKSTNTTFFPVVDVRAFGRSAIGIKQ